MANLVCVYADFFDLFFLSPFYIVPRRHLYFLIRVWCWGACFFAGQWLIKKGNLPDLDGEPYLYMFNHVSLFDQFMVAAFIGHYVTVVGAVEQFRWPIWGTVGRKYGAIPIMRKQIKKAVKRPECCRRNNLQVEEVP